MQTLSVWETLRFAARLSLPSEIPRAKSVALCEQTLATMGLWRVRHTKVMPPVSQRRSSKGPLHAGKGSDGRGSTGT